MVALETPKATIGWNAPEFSLKGTDGAIHTLQSAKGAKATVVMFICNHCPYVLKQLDRMIALTHALKTHEVNVIAINPNDSTHYPEDSFEAMQAMAKERNFPFLYLHDETQSVARAYHAVCTPDIFGFDANLELKYRGRLDESWSGVLDKPKQELFEAMMEIAQTGSTSKAQNPSVGCSIKWRRESQSAVG